MTALGVNMTNREPTIGWEGISASHKRPRQTLGEYLINLWEIADEALEAGQVEKCREIQDIAGKLQDFLFNLDPRTEAERDQDILKADHRAESDYVRTAGHPVKKEESRERKPDEVLYDDVADAKICARFGTQL